MESNCGLRGAGYELPVLRLWVVDFGKANPQDGLASKWAYHFRFMN
jgi:hypothetical protein